FRCSALILLLAFATDCADRLPTAPASDPLGRLIVVSGALPESSAISIVDATRRTTRATTPAVTTVAYVSLPPYSVQGASTAVIRNATVSDSVTVAISDGGFDPTPI